MRQVNTGEIFKRLGIRREDHDDLHVTRMMHAFVAVSGGRVVAVEEPRLEYCPLVNVLYDVDQSVDRAEMKRLVVEMTEEKIAKFGHFTERRELKRSDIAVPYGASEMTMIAMQKGVLDCSVTVCDGAGTVVAAVPDLVQGVGARMNGLFYTSPIPAVIEGIESRGGVVPFAATAEINQTGGVRRAAEMGHTNIAVTINGCLGESLAEVRAVEKEFGVSVTIIIVCTTAASRSRVEEIRDHADMVWSCASGSIRTVVGPASIIQVTTAIPVFAITERGVRFLAAYCDTPEVFDELDLGRQYLIAGNSGGREIRMGRMKTAIAECTLPVRSGKEPRPLTE